VPRDAMFVRLLDPRTGELLREHLSGNVAGTASAMEIARVVRRRSCFNCWHVRTRQEPTSALSAKSYMLVRANSECVASRAFSNWSTNMEARLQTMPVRRRWSCASPSIASCAAIWSATRRLLSVCGKSIHSSAN